MITGLRTVAEQGAGGFDTVNTVLTTEEDGLDMQEGTNSAHH